MEKALNRSTSSLLKLGKEYCLHDLIKLYSETVTRSFGYNGKGVATYPNGDIYDGHFKDGVSLINYLSRDHNLTVAFEVNRLEMVKKVPTSISLRPMRRVLPQRTSMLVDGKTIRNTVSAK